LLRSTRQHYHQRIAQVLEERFPETIAAQPEVLAHHYTEASLVEHAIPYWQQAGQHASARSAHVEAMSHLRQGLALLTALPDTPARTQHELTLRIALGVPLRPPRGLRPRTWKPTIGGRGSCAIRSRMSHACFIFCVGSMPIIWCERSCRPRGSWVRTCSPSPSRARIPSLSSGAHWALGGALFCLGEFVRARAHWDQSLALEDAARHAAPTFLWGWDLGVLCRFWTPHALWHLGYPDQALALSGEAVTLAQQLSHPFSLAASLDYAAMFQQFRREPQAVHERAEAAITLCTEQGFAYYLAWGTTMEGWACVMQGEGEAGMAQTQRGLAALRATGASLRLPYYLALLAEVCGHTDQATEGLTLVAEALAHVHTTGECWWEAELQRLKGELLLRLSAERDVEAEACFRSALERARAQQAKALELRAATSLGRLWQRQGKHAEAYALLAPVYGWFTEGFDTGDLQDAKTLLEELGV
jgi:tetratricopeptide (TPR) repeat protein